MDKSQVKTYTFEGKVRGLSGRILQPPERARTFRYGKLTKLPYATQNLWFIDLLSAPVNGQTFTCLVDETYAKPAIFEDYGWDLTLWKKVAYRIMEHPWGYDYFNECMWVESPVNTFVLPDGKTLWYGYSRTQSDAHPDRQLWYMSMLPGRAVIIDRECLEPDFIMKMHNARYVTRYKAMRELGYWWRWVEIAWCHVVSEAIGEGDECRYVNSFEPRPLDLVSENSTPNIHKIIEQEKLSQEKNGGRYGLYDIFRRILKP